MSEDEHQVDSVVWYELPDSGLKSVFWPCKVMSIDDDTMVVESFDDCHQYELTKSKCATKVKPFNCPASNDLLTKGRKKLRHMKGTLSIFIKAVEEGLEFYRTRHNDPTFILDFDCDFSKSFSSQKDRSIQLNASVFTTGGCTTDDSQTPPSAKKGSTRKRKLPNSSSKLGERNLPPDPLQPKSLSPNRKRSKGNRKHELVEKTKEPGREFMTESASKRLDFDDPLLPSNDSDKNYHGDYNESRRPAKPQKDSNQKQSSKARKSNTRKAKRKSQTEPYDSACDMDHSSPKDNGELSSRNATTGESSKEQLTATSKDRPLIDSVKGMDDEPNSQLPVSPVPQGVGISTHAAAAGISSGESLFNPGYKSLLEEIRNLSSEDDLDEGSSESDDSELPAVDFSVDENVRLQKLKPNGVVWVKWRAHPFWPALVTKVNVQKKNISVKFLGYNDVDQDLRIKNHKNVSLYFTEKKDQFKEVGHKCKEKRFFFQAVEDAEKLIRLRAEGEIRGTPDEQYQQILERRPVSHLTGESPMALSSRSRLSEETREIPLVDIPPPVHGGLLESDSESDEVHISSSEGEEDNEDYTYNYKKVMQVVSSIETELVDIAKGNTESRRHKDFTSGTEKQKQSLTREGGFGPLKKWTNPKRFMFVEHLSNMIKNPEHEPLDKPLTPEYLSNKVFLQEYTMGVLVPESLIKVMMTVEALSYNDAENRL